VLRSGLAVGRPAGHPAESLPRCVRSRWRSVMGFCDHEHDRAPTALRAWSKASIMIATLGRSDHSRKNWIGILRAVGSWDAPRSRGPCEMTGTHKGDIWFVWLAGPRLSLGLCDSDAMREKGSGLVWDADTFKCYVAEPQRVVVDTTMSAPPLRNEQERADLTA